MSDKEFSWNAPLALDREDEKLIEAYTAVGCPLDGMVYTAQFDELMKKIGQEPNEANKHHAYRRLLQLRKRGMLPRIYPQTAEEPGG